MQLDHGHGQCVERPHQGRQDEEMAVQRQEGQHRDDVEPARKYGGADEFPRRLHGGEHQAHREAHGDADQHLLHHHPQAGERPGRDRRHGVQRRADGDGQHKGQTDLDLDGDDGFGEQGGRAHQRQDAHERPEELADPAV
ncbi:hypothetical protein G6F31_016776 [Rhizopus arrhizus]|nr:hypothetical protein G6F31_016776 [Rhizopus arrhizus]